MSLQEYFDKLDRERQAYFNQIDQSCANTLGITLEQLNNLDWETDPLQAKIQAAFDHAVIEQSRNKQSK